MPIQAPLEKTVSRYPVLRRLLERDDWESMFLQDMKKILETYGYVTHNQAVASCKILKELEMRAQS